MIDKGGEWTGLNMLKTAYEDQQKFLAAQEQEKAYVAGTTQAMGQMAEKNQTKQEPVICLIARRLDELSNQHAFYGWLMQSIERGTLTPQVEKHLYRALINLPYIAKF